jgi:DNA polymerase alpha subunit A
MRITDLVVQVVKTKADDDFLQDLLGEVDTNIPAPIPRQSKHERSGERRKARNLSPAPEPASKKKKTFDTRLPPLPAPSADLQDDDGYMPPMDEDLPSAADVPMSDPAPSSPAAKAAQRKVQIKQEPKDDEEEEDMMEVAHASTVNTTSVNMTGARPVKRLLKSEPNSSPAISSPLKPAQTDVDSSSWNALTDKLNVVSSPSAETRSVGKIDHTDAVEADGSLNFFWTDYTEVNGSLCLFGKVLNKKTGNYVSCFVKVDNIMRKLYFLPREYRVRDGEETGEEVEMMDVYSEVDDIMTKMNVGMHKIKQCTRKYAFELPGIPKEAQYMKLLYPYTSKSESLTFRPPCNSG